MRSDKKDQSIFELKKLVESQLKQIIVLQKEVELARQGLASGSATMTPVGHLSQTPAKPVPDNSVS